MRLKRGKFEIFLLFGISLSLCTIFLYMGAMPPVVQPHPLPIRIIKNSNNNDDVDTNVIDDDDSGVQQSKLTRFTEKLRQFAARRAKEKEKEKYNNNNEGDGGGDSVDVERLGKLRIRPQKKKGGEDDDENNKQQGGEEPLRSSKEEERREAERIRDRARKWEDMMDHDVHEALIAKQKEASGASREEIEKELWCTNQWLGGFDHTEYYCQAADGHSDFSCTWNMQLGGALCTGHNVQVDLTRISVASGGEPIDHVKGRSEDVEFARYNQGAFTVDCHNQKRFPTTKLPHHLGDIANSLQGGIMECDGWVEEDVLGVTRYEYANLYHSLGDFYNAVHHQHLLKLGPNPLVVFFDGHSQGAMDEAWRVLYKEENIVYISQLGQYLLHKSSSSSSSSSSPSSSVSPQNMKSKNPAKKICFRKLILVSPAYRAPLSVEFMGSLPTCPANDGTRLFADHMLHAFQISDFQNGGKSGDDDGAKEDEDRDDDEGGGAGGGGSGEIILQPVFKTSINTNHKIIDLNDVIMNKKQAYPPFRSSSSGGERAVRILFIFRKTYLAHPRASPQNPSPRVVKNEGEVLTMLNEIKGTVEIMKANFETLSFRDQLQAVRNADILIGVHGAALSHVLFMKNDWRSWLIEINAGEFLGRPHFLHFAKWAGVRYNQPACVRESNYDGMSVNPALLRTAIMDALTTFQPPTKSAAKTPLVIQPPATTKAPPPPPPPPVLKGDKDKSRNRHTAVGKSNTPSLDPSPKRMAIVVPFRDSKSNTSQGQNRTENLNIFVPYMKKWLTTDTRLPGRDFEIWVIEQTEGALFNKGALFNAGYLLLRDRGFDYMVLHDVDQLPESPWNTYKYPELRPVHLCSASSQFNYAPAYNEMIGGALAIRMDHYETLGGYSNYYWGWGQEDDDFYFRVKDNLGLDRLVPAEGRYKASSHPRVMDLDITPIFTRGTAHLQATAKGDIDPQTDGYKTLKFEPVSIDKQEQGYWRALVQLRLDYMPIDTKGNTAPPTPN